MNGMTQTLRQLAAELRDSNDGVATLAGVDQSFFDKITPLEGLIDIQDDLRSIADAISGCASTIEANWPPALFDLSRARVNGRPIRSLEIFEEEDYWRWRIVDDRGVEFVDGGNHMLRSECGESLSAALEYASS
ncbi:MAG: hypothetical protein KDI73_11675 [Candidatus Competibacteraceae bacterium]|nr:hypothetical protein [Candidatus Competibacteraceae bacterium]